MRSSWPVCASHTFTAGAFAVLSSAPPARRLPSGLKTTLHDIACAEGAGFRTGGRIPDLHGPIPAARGQPGPVGTEDDAVDSAGVPLEGEEFLAGLGVPHLHRPIVATALARRLPSGLKATLCDQAVCPLRERSSWPVCASHTFTVVTRAGQAFAVRAEGHAVATALEGEEFLAGLGIPHLHDLVCRSPLARRLPSGLKATLVT